MIIQKQQKKVLIIDDDAVLVRLVEKWLKVPRYEVIHTLSGKEGLKMAKEERPDCILLDVLMPDMDGKVVARKLKEQAETRDIPIIFMTVTIDVKKDKGHQSFVIDGKSYPAFAKPLHIRKLLSTIRKEINKRIHRNI